MEMVYVALKKVAVSVHRTVGGVLIDAAMVYVV